MYLKLEDYTGQDANARVIVMSKGNNKLRLYFSYETLIGIESKSHGNFVTNVKYSRTTSKHLTRAHICNALGVDEDSLQQIASEAIASLSKDVYN